MEQDSETDVLYGVGGGYAHVVTGCWSSFWTWSYEPQAFLQNLSKLVKSVHSMTHTLLHKNSRNITIKQRLLLSHHMCPHNSLNGPSGSLSGWSVAKGPPVWNNPWILHNLNPQLLSRFLHGTWRIAPVFRHRVNKIRTACWIWPESHLVQLPKSHSDSPLCLGKDTWQQDTCIQLPFPWT